jgi:hypothetical protein
MTQKEMRTEYMSPRILGDLRERMGAESATDPSKDNEINSLSNHDAFDNFLQWNGIIGYTAIIRQVFCEIYGIEMEKLER